jgi:hypothetical protein
MILSIFFASQNIYLQFCVKGIPPPMAHKQTFSEKLTGDALPYIIMGIGIFMLCWVFFLGDMITG